ncbi:M12 family metallopeptidase [Pedobacter sp. 22226]|uniref:M12 family metallopeptidase n=1 Tax=Pedobacter sp. 22226 TaxID=3453894 RepID=UPI003F87E973
MKKIYYAFAALIIFLSACKKEASVKEEEQQNTLGKVITYHLKNGGQVTVQINSKVEYVVGGDVILSNDQIAYLEYNKVGGGKTSTPRSTFTAEFQKLWPNGIVYYVINDAAHSSDILGAMSDWEASTSIRFIQRTNQANYVNFQGAPPNGGGDSQLGMIGGQQLIRLAAGADKSTVTHEIGHAVGLMHEQCRTDRDQYININFSNINSDWTYQYATYNVQGRSGAQLGAFDFNSIMLYPSSVPEARVGGNTSPQMTRKDGSVWWYNDHLSQGDIDGVNYLYMPINIVYDFVDNEYLYDGFNHELDREVSIYFTRNNISFALPKDIMLRVRKIRNVYESQFSPYFHYYTHVLEDYNITVPQGSTGYYIGSMQIREHNDQNMNPIEGSFIEDLSVLRIQ